MRTLIVIPTRNRPQNIAKYVLPLVESIGLDYKIFVEPTDGQQYDCPNKVYLDRDHVGLAGAVKQADDYAKANGYGAIFKIDDDVRRIGNIEADIEKICRVLERPRIGAVVFPYSFEWYAFSKKLFTRLNKRLQTAYIVRTGLYKDPGLKDRGLFEDFYQYVNLRTQGWNTIFCARHSIELAKMVGEGAGGLQDKPRNRERAMEAIRAIQKLDPSIGLRERPEKKWLVEPKLNGKRYRSSEL